MIVLDGTENKSRLGANAILGVSLAAAKAAAEASGLPLYNYLGGVNARVLPVPMMNIINGGAHADNPIDIQEFMIMPVGAASFAEALRMGAEVFHTLSKLLKDGGHNTNVGDEGGFAPNLKSADEALGFISRADREGRLQARRGGRCWRSTPPPPSSSRTASITWKARARCSTRTGWSRYYADLAARYPIVSIEDGMAEDDWEGWKALTARSAARCQLVGDDLFVTNSTACARASKRASANAILVKVNQIGTLTETLDAVDDGAAGRLQRRDLASLGRDRGSTIADLAVATNAGQIKTGSLSRSDRLAKYNQLLRIEEELDTMAVYAGPGRFCRLTPAPRVARLIGP